MMSRGGISVAADALEVRIAHLEGIYEQVDKRLSAIEVRLGDLDRNIDRKIDGLRADLDRKIDLLKSDVNRVPYFALHTSGP
jgi:hypothetical protein